MGSEPVEASLSEHDAVLPPLLPAQLHAHGPMPLTVEAVPAVQRFAVGAVLTDAPFALPHAPFVSSKAEQLAVVPPLEPAQVQLQGPLPLTLEAVPALQRFAVGALVRSAAFEEPHAPLTLVLPLDVVVWPGGCPSTCPRGGPGLDGTDCACAGPRKTRT